MLKIIFFQKLEPIKIYSKSYVKKMTFFFLIFWKKNENIQKNVKKSSTT